MRVLYGAERGGTYGKSRSDQVESNQQEEVAQARLSHGLLVWTLWGGFKPGRFCLCDVQHLCVQSRSRFVSSSNDWSKWS